MVAARPHAPRGVTAWLVTGLAAAIAAAVLGDKGANWQEDQGIFARGGGACGMCGEIGKRNRRERQPSGVEVNNALAGDASSTASLPFVSAAAAAATVESVASAQDVLGAPVLASSANASATAAEARSPSNTSFIVAAALDPCFARGKARGGKRQAIATSARLEAALVLSGSLAAAATVGERRLTTDRPLVVVDASSGNGGGGSLIEVRARKACAASGEKHGEKIGCRHQCQCGWLESCYTKIDDGEGASMEDVGVCGFSPVFMVVSSAVVVIVLFCATVGCRLALIDRGLLSEEQQLDLYLGKG